jgi:thiamine-monophosphate kinase
VATSATDISDGLAADLNNICEASGVGAIIQSNQIPLSEWFPTHLIETKKLDLTDMISGGGDYELIFTAPPNYNNDILNLSKKIDLRLSKVGTVVKGNSVRILDSHGKEIPLNTKGFRHF